MSENILDRDLTHLWHPCTQMKDHEALPPIAIRKGQGIWLEDFDGNRYIDAISSWWVNLFGHCHPKISSAVKQQLDELEHVILAGFTHQPVVDLSEKLAQITPGNLSRCFYSDNGSSAVEVALKMSYHYWKNQGQPGKSKFVSLSNGYHGETLGALSVGDVPLYKETYEPLLLDCITVPSPDCYLRDQGETWEAFSQRRFDALRDLLEREHQNISAVILEPLVQCAGNMRMYHPIYLKLLRQACDEFGVHFIADEIAVGFGRTGSLFACEQADVAPDFLCLSKGLTGGYLPLSVVVTSEDTYQAFYDDYETLKAFLHSHSYTGNALACSAALATLELFEDGQVIEDNRQKAKKMYEAVETLEDHPNVAEIRQTGMILAIEMVKEKSARTPWDWRERRGRRVYEYGLKNSVLLRPLGDVVYFMPPYIISDEEIALMAQVAIDGIHLAAQD